MKLVKDFELDVVCTSNWWLRFGRKALVARDGDIERGFVSPFLAKNNYETEQSEFTHRPAR